MIVVKIFFYFILILITFTSFSSCKSSQNNNYATNKLYTLQQQPPLILDTIYFQQWVAGVKDGGSGVYVFFKLKEDISIIFDSIYFKNQVSKIEKKPNGYVAHFLKKLTTNNDIISSNEKYAEYGNTLPKNNTFPFQLQENEAVLSYKHNNVLQYYKVSNIPEKPFQALPSTKPID